MIIRNADDFGKSEQVNRAILEAFEKGYIDRTTLMVNMPAAEEAVAEARTAGLTDRIGIHLNLTEGEPLTDAIKKNPLFCDSEGRFHAGFRSSTKNRLYMNRCARREIYMELTAQLQAYRDFGLDLWHIDSHHHVHTDYPIYHVIRKLSGEYEFTSIRQTRNLFTGVSVPIRLYKNLYNGSLKKICGETTDYFGSVQDLFHYCQAIGGYDSLKDSYVELMLHPMYDQNGVLVDTTVPMEEEYSRLKDLTGLND